MAQGRVVWREVRMSDVPTTREPVPCPRWNDYQVVQRAAMNHSYSILQNAPSLSQTAGRSVNRLANQSVRRAERRLIPSDLDTPRYRKLAKVKATQITKLYLNQHSEKCSAGYFISHIPSFPPLIGVWPVMNGCNLWSLGDEIIQSCFYYYFFLLEQKHVADWGPWIDMHNHIPCYQGSAAQRLSNRNPLGFNELWRLHLKHLCKHCWLLHTLR